MNASNVSNASNGLNELHAAQRSLVHLIGGRAIGVVLGLAVLAVMWRRVPAAALGHYLALLALLEALYLASGVGLSTLAQRHLPEWRWQSRSVDRTALGLLGLRVVLGVAAGGMVAWVWAPLNRLLGLDEALVPVWLFVLWMGLGSAARALEELQASFMMQDALQGLAVLGHLLRLPALLSLSEPGTTVWLIQLELAVVGVLTAVGLWWIRSRLSRQGTAAGACAPGMSASGPPPDLREGLKAWRLGLRFWGIQLLGLGFGSSAVRLAVAVLGGPVAVAFHGAAQALVDAVRNALPITLLAGWLRPALLRLHLMGSQADAPPKVLGDAVLKLSLLPLIPVAALLIWQGPAVLELMIGAELMSQAHEMSLSSPGAPPPSAILAPLLTAAALQSAHQARSLHCLTISAPAPAERATRWAAVLALPTMALAWPWLGLWSAPLGVIVAEAVWVWLVDRGLGSPRSPDRGRWWGLLGIAILGAAAVDLGTRVLRDAGLDPFTGPTAGRLVWPSLTLLVAACGTAWGVWLLRPLRAHEVAILLAHLPDATRHRTGQVVQRLRSGVRSVRALRQLASAFAHDAWSYARGSGLLRQDRVAAQAQLLKTAHRIDKGLALPAPRPGFGREALMQLDHQLQTFAARHGADWAWDEAVRTVARYRLHQVGAGRAVSAPTPILDAGVTAVLARWWCPPNGSDTDRQHAPTIEAATLLTRETVQAQARGSFESLVRSRRSIRQFAADAVPRAALTHAVGLAAHTPSVCNRAGARVWAVFDAKRRQALLKHQNGHHGFADRASALLIVTVRPEVFDSVGERHQGWIDGGLFAMTLILALHEQGLGTCCLNWSVRPEVDAAFKREAGLPRDELVVMLVAVGTLPPVFSVAHSPRRPLDELLTWLDERPFPTGDETR